MVVHISGERQVLSVEQVLYICSIFSVVLTERFKLCIFTFKKNKFQVQLQHIQNGHSVSCLLIWFFNVCLALVQCAIINCCEYMLCLQRQLDNCLCRTACIVNETQWNSWKYRKWEIKALKRGIKKGKFDLPVSETHLLRGSTFERAGKEQENICEYD